MKKLATVGLASLLAVGAITTYVHAEDEQVQGNDISIQSLFDKADAEDAAAKAAADKAAAAAKAEKEATEKFLKEKNLVENGGTYVGEEAQTTKDGYDVKLQGLDQNHPGEQGYTPAKEVKEATKPEAKVTEKAAVKPAAKAAVAPAKAVVKTATKALPKTSAVK